ncbi:MAG TPA: hypothetical protein VHA12_00520 [Candidatus Nanoarchaeia archaeon]|nr:hypothetical protein [Candidatus Nanoarchaeia archaeon]
MNKPYEQVNYQLFLEIAERQTHQKPQAKGLASKILGLARQERIRIDPLNSLPINDSDLTRIYAHYARPEQQDMLPESLGKGAFCVLHNYLVRRDLISSEEVTLG